MDKELQPLIDQEYERIADKMRAPATLFGYSIDTGDMKQMVIAAYHAGVAESEGRWKEYRQLDRELDAAVARAWQ